MNRASQNEHQAVASIPPVSTVDVKPDALKGWSSLAKVCELLRIECPHSVADDVVHFRHMQFRPRQCLHTIGQPFDSLYVVNAGFLKTITVDEFGHEMVLGFPMRGELIGAESVYRKQYLIETVALSNCDLIRIPFKVFLSLGQEHPALAPSLFSMMSRANAHQNTAVNLLGAFTSEARLARFLLWMSRRFAEMGYSSTEFNLHMSREEIGLYLGSTLATVSRAFSALNASGLISVKQRSVIIRNLDGLYRLARLTTARIRLRQKSAASPSLVP